MGNIWESSGGVGSYAESVRRLMMEPAAFFDETDPSDTLARPLIFAAISCSIGAAANVFWTVVLGAIQIMPQTSFMAPVYSQEAVMGETTFYSLFWLTYPVHGIAGLFVGGAITQLFLLLFSAGGRGYIGTVKAGCYATAPALLFLIPCCGNVVGGIWMFVLQIIGLIHIHKSPPGAVIAAVLLPTFLCCCCIVMAFLAFGATLAAMMGPQFVEILRQVQPPG